MKISDMIESKYLKQSDIGEEVKLVTIKGLKKMNLARDDEAPEYRWTMTFTELEKPMVLNVTNLKRVAKALGDDTEQWMGEKIELYVDPDIEFGGNVVGGLRLRGVRRAGAKPRQATLDDANKALRQAGDDESDIPF